ncbi:DUF3902 family protein [Bacillus cereus]
MCWFLFMLVRGGGDWLLSWVGVFMAFFIFIHVNRFIL